MGSGSFPVDILLFGMIAAFLVLRLRSILGRRTGFDRQADAPSNVVGLRPVAAALDAPAVAPSSWAVPAPNSPAGRTIVQIQQADPSFDGGRFLTGAEAAFGLIVGAFARGDREALRPLLTADTYTRFEGAIAARELAGEVQKSELRAMPTVAVEEAYLAGTQASVTVRFVSDQISETLDRDGKTVAGTDAVTELTDLWTFERDVSQPDPAWRLSATRSG